MARRLNRTAGLIAASAVALALVAPQAPWSPSATSYAAAHAASGPARTAPLGARSAAGPLPGARVVEAASEDGLVGIIITVAGSGVRGFGGDGGPATRAQLNLPSGVAVAPDGSVYIADTLNHRVRRVSPDGQIVTVAGTGVAGAEGDGRLGTRAQLNEPSALAVGPDGVLYVADSGNHRVRLVSPAGYIGTAAGVGIPGFAGDSGPATLAELNQPGGVAVHTDGTLFIADSANDRVRKSTGAIRTVAGGGTGGDGGLATRAQLASPRALAVGPDGALYIAETYGNRVRVVGRDDIIRTVTRERVERPSGLAFDARGRLYLSESNVVRRLDAGGLTVIAGSGAGGFAGDDGPATQARLGAPSGIAIGPDGSLYIADTYNHRVRRVVWLRPQVTIGSATVQPGETLGVEGWGFRPWATSATISARSTDAATPTVVELGTARLSAGRFRAVIAIPTRLPSGRYRVGAGDGAVAASSAGTLAVAAEPSTPQPQPAPRPLYLPIVLRAP